MISSTWIGHIKMQLHVEDYMKCPLLLFLLVDPKDIPAACLCSRSHEKDSGTLWRQLVEETEKVSLQLNTIDFLIHSNHPTIF